MIPTDIDFVMTMFSKFFFNWDSLYAMLNSHYKVWSYKNKKNKKIKACMNSL